MPHRERSRRASFVTPGTDTQQAANESVGGNPNATGVADFFKLPFFLLLLRTQNLVTW
jgi:hypothetical protein